jgi:hypothetical protein
VKQSQEHKGFEHKALQRLAHTVVMKEQMETAQVDNMWAQELVLAQLQLAVLMMKLNLGSLVDDGIYMSHQTYTARFLHNRSTLFHPVFHYVHVYINLKCTSRKYIPI